MYAEDLGSDTSAHRDDRPVRIARTSRSRRTGSGRFGSSANVPRSKPWRLCCSHGRGARCKQWKTSRPWLCRWKEASSRSRSTGYSQCLRILCMVFGQILAWTSSCCSLIPPCSGSRTDSDREFFFGGSQIGKSQKGLSLFGISQTLKVSC